MKATHDVWIWAIQSEYGGEREWHYSVTANDGMAEHGWVLVEQRTIEFQVPSEKELTTKTVEAMRGALQKMKGDHYVAEKRMEERINSLLAIDYKPESAQSAP